MGTLKRIAPILAGSTPEQVGSAYLGVDDADEIAASWRSAGVEVHWPEDTDWGRHEGAVVDPGRQRDPLRLPSQMSTRVPTGSTQSIGAVRTEP